MTPNHPDDCERCYWKGRAEAAERALADERAKVADAWDEGYIHGRQMQADATSDEAITISSTTLATRAWLKSTARSLAGNLRTAKGSIHDNPYRAEATQ